MIHIKNVHPIKYVYRLSREAMSAIQWHSAIQYGMVRDLAAKCMYLWKGRHGELKLKLKCHCHRFQIKENCSHQATMTNQMWIWHSSDVIGPQIKSPSLLLDHKTTNEKNPNIYLLRHSPHNICCPHPAAWVSTAFDIFPVQILYVHFPYGYYSFWYLINI